jgi:hypothetical protein
MNRRKFFAFLPFAPLGAVMATAAVAKAPSESLAPDKELLTLNAHKAPPPPKPSLDSFSSPKYGIINGGTVTITKPFENSSLKVGSCFKVVSDNHTDEDKKVSLAVGKDGHLWVKIGDGWKRVVTE